MYKCMFVGFILVDLTSLKIVNVCRGVHNLKFLLQLLLTELFASQRHGP